jgi:hypothetical protein
VSTVFEYTDQDGDGVAIEKAHGGGYAVVASDRDGESQVVVYLDEKGAQSLREALG